MTVRGWACEIDRFRVRHIYPTDDLIDHILEVDSVERLENGLVVDSRCWCRPIAKDGMVVHNSADLREDTGK